MAVNNNILADWYNQLPAAQQRVKKLEIVNKLGITTKTFYNKLNGKSKLSNAETAIIQQMIVEEVL